MHKHLPLLLAATAGALLLAGVSVSPAAHGRDRVVGDPARVGAFMGAMHYCEDRFDEREGRYRLARLNSLREIEDMDGDDRVKALAASRISKERGSFFGDELNRHECRRLLSLGEWKRFTD